jgi:hypothetical protein
LLIEILRKCLKISIGKSLFKTEHYLISELLFTFASKPSRTFTLTHLKTFKKRTKCYIEIIQIFPRCFLYILNRLNCAREDYLFSYNHIIQVIYSITFWHIYIYIYIYICRFQNVFLRCPTPTLHCFLSSHWPSFRFLSSMAFPIPSIQFFLYIIIRHKIYV